MWDREHRFKGVDGQWHHVLARGIPIRNEQGLVLGWAGINLDIDRLKNSEAALREADRRKDEFLATLAHELRNPLAPIRNGLQIMRLAQGDQESIEQVRTMMERQLEQMVHLVDDLLDLSRISRGKIELRKERIELAKIIQQAVETSRPAIEQAGHELTIDVPTSPIYVDADLTRLAQVFSNLLNNAAKYTERGGRVRLTIQQRANEAVVSVKDSGVGIPIHMLPNVFDMFTQVDRNLERSQGGLGIGLSIVKRLVEMHDGTVEAKSDGHGMGSEFLVRLPMVLSLVQPQKEQRVPTKPSSRRRVLVVDDNKDAAVSLAMMLKLMGNETDDGARRARSARCGGGVPTRPDPAGHRNAQDEWVRHRPAHSRTVLGQRCDPGGAHGLGAGRRPSQIRRGRIRLTHGQAHRTCGAGETAGKRPSEHGLATLRSMRHVLRTTST